MLESWRMMTKPKGDASWARVAGGAAAKSQRSALL